MKTNERVILIKGDATKWYDQAIFIVNKDIPPEKVPIDFVAEAEKIINNYIMKKNRQTAPKIASTTSRSAINGFTNTRVGNRTPLSTRAARDKRFDFVLNMVMLAGCLAIAIVFFFGLLY